MYIPPFTVSAEAINLIAEISGQIERYAIRLEQEDGLRLRKVNRIKTIHSSLAIEGNTLSEEQVRDIIDGKNVVAPIKEIQEVKNAIKTYEMYPTLDAFKEKDLLKAHAVMMQALVDNPGHYRHGGVGVFGESTNKGESGPFIDFMLSEIYKTLKSHQGEELPTDDTNPIDKEFGVKFGVKFGIKFGANEKQLLLLLNETPGITAQEIAEHVGISKRGVEKQLKKLKDFGVISREGSDKSGYWIINK